MGGSRKTNYKDKTTQEISTERISKPDVYVLLGFDMETDIGSYTRTYEGVRVGTRKILEIIEEYGIEATFLFTGDAAAKNKKVVCDLRDLGHEIGCHSLQHETVGDALFNIPSDRGILEEEARPRLEKNVQIVEEIIGERPVSFRAPRLWQGTSQVLALEELGFLVDASYSQYKYREMILPYHPSKENWLKKGDLKILELPNFCFVNNDIGLLESYTGLDQWPKLRTLGADFVFDGIKAVIEKQFKTSDVAVLTFYLHPWEAIEIPEKYAYDEGVFYFHRDIYINTGDYFVEQLRIFIERCLEEGFKFTTFKKFYYLGLF
ncbi:MAG: polysaccharide deacetylase family protein [Actinobacteria bacterium]|nr:polysaccharide deacetylase family protein [Actinomycetota bacterium]